MIVEQNVPLQAHNTFGIVAKARALVRVRGESEVQELLADPEFGTIPKFVLGGGSNIILTGDVKPLVLKVEVPGRRLVEDGPRATIVEAGGGEKWHEFVGSVKHDLQRVAHGDELPHLGQSIHVTRHPVSAEPVIEASQLLAPTARLVR